MKKSKRKEIFKMAGASVLSLGLLCAMFIAGNQVVFAHAASQTMSLPNVTATATLPPQSNVPPPYYPNPVFTVNELVRFGEAAPANAISAAAAAELGSQYIWEVFGVNIDGSAVNMMYTVNHFGVRNYWMGFVAESQEHLDNRTHTFSFHIDSVSGLRVGIRDERAPDVELPEVAIVIDASNQNNPFTVFANPPQNLSHYEALAKEFAGLHFNFTEIASAEFSTRFPVATGRNNNSITFREVMLQFIVIDSLGREATIEFTEAGRLVRICTLRSDIIPGINAHTNRQPTTVIPDGSRVLPPLHLQPNDRAVNPENSNLINGLTVAEWQEIRNNPNHPRHHEIFGSGR